MAVGSSPVTFLASELGHIKILGEPKKDAESMIGGKSVEKRYGLSGFTLHNMAERGDRKAIKIFNEIGVEFGQYLASIAYLFDPEIVIIGGSFINSWKFIKSETCRILREETIRRKMKIELVRGKFYVIKGCYFLDEYEKANN